jgi:hypothetical protein
MLLDAQTPQALQRTEEALSHAMLRYIHRPCFTYLSPSLWSPQVLHDSPPFLARLTSDDPPLAGAIFCNDFKVICPIQPRLQKDFRSRLTQISSRSSAVPPTEGWIASRHERGMGCGGRGSVGAAGNRGAGFGL